MLKDEAKGLKAKLLEKRNEVFDLDFSKTNSQKIDWNYSTRALFQDWRNEG